MEEVPDSKEIVMPFDLKPAQVETKEFISSDEIINWIFPVTIIILFLLIIGLMVYGMLENYRLRDRFLIEEEGWTEGKIRACDHWVNCRFFNTLEEQTAFEEWKEKQ